jgi:transposase-like protein
VLARTDAATIQAAVIDSVIPNSTLYTDEHGSYAGMDVAYNHASVNHSAKEFVNGMAHTNGIESVWAVLKRGFYGVYHSFSEKHLQRYVDEFSFRLNEGNVKNRTMSRIDSLLGNSVGVRITYKDSGGGVATEPASSRQMQAPIQQAGLLPKRGCLRDKMRFNLFPVLKRSRYKGNRQGIESLAGPSSLSAKVAHEVMYA